MNELPWTLIILSVAGTLFAALIAFIAASYWFRKNDEVRLAQELKNEAIARAAKLAEANLDHVARTTRLEQELASLKTAVVPISAAFQAILIKELTHYHTPVTDRLLEKLENGTLAPTEERELSVALEERTRDMNGDIPESERDAARMLPMVIKRVRAEAVLMYPEVQLVAVPPTAEK